MGKMFTRKNDQSSLIEHVDVRWILGWRSSAGDAGRIVE